MTLKRTGSAVFASVLSTTLFLCAWAVPNKPRKAAPPSPAVGGTLALMPSSAILDGSYSLQTLSAVQTASDGSSLEVTSQAAFKSSNPGVVRIQNGVGLPVGDGQADVTATIGGRTATARFTVKNFR